MIFTNKGNGCGSAKQLNKFIDFSLALHIFCIKNAAARQKKTSKFAFLHSPCTFFLPKSLHNPNKCFTFAAQEPAKPLNNAQPTTNREQCQTCLNIAEVRRRKRFLEAQMSGSFFFYMYLNQDLFPCPSGKILGNIWLPRNLKRKLN